MSASGIDCGVILAMQQAERSPASLLELVEELRLQGYIDDTERLRLLGLAPPEPTECAAGPTTATCQPTWKRCA